MNEWTFSPRCKGFIPSRHHNPWVPDPEKESHPNVWIWKPTGLYLMEKLRTSGNRTVPLQQNHSPQDQRKEQQFLKSLDHMWRKFIYWPYSILSRGRVCWDSAGMGCWQLPFYRLPLPSWRWQAPCCTSISNLLTVGVWQPCSSHSTNTCSWQQPRTPIPTAYNPTGSQQASTASTGCPQGARLRLTGRLCFWTHKPQQVQESSRNSKKLGQV